MPMRLLNVDKSVPRLSDELVRANLRRLREEPGNRRWHTDEVDTLGHLTWERIADRYEAAGGPPVSPETLRTDWFGTRGKVRRYGWEQLIHLAQALDVSLFEIILPAEDNSLGIYHAAEVFRMPVEALRSHSRRALSTMRHRSYILYNAILWHPMITQTQDTYNFAVAAGVSFEEAAESWVNQKTASINQLLGLTNGHSSPMLDKLVEMMAEQGALTFGGSDTETRERLPGFHKLPHKEAFTILRELGVLTEEAN